MLAAPLCKKDKRARRKKKRNGEENGWSDYSGTEGSDASAMVMSFPGCFRGCFLIATVYELINQINKVGLNASAMSHGSVGTSRASPFSRWS